MPQIFTAASTASKYVPAFTVEKLDGTYTKKLAKMRDDGKNGKKNISMDFHDETADCGWLVSFPAKHGNKPNSIHIETMDELKRMGFDRTTIPLVDEDGEAVDAIPNNIRTRKVKTDA